MSLGCGEEIGGYTVSPPQLAADAPVLYILEPIFICGFIFCGVEFQLVVKYGRQGDVGKVLHTEEPLHTESGLYCGVGITLAVAYLVDVVLYFLHKACRFEVFYYLLAHLHTIHSNVHSCCLAQCSIGIENVDCVEVVLLTQHIVVGVVGGGYL